MSRPPGDETLKKLALGAKQGDSKAYGKLFQAFYKDIYNYIFRLVGNPVDSEDLTMQVFANGLAAVQRYEERGTSIRAWFYRIAHNVVVDHFRATSRFVDIDQVPLVSTHPTKIEDDLSSKQEFERLYKEILKLPIAQAEVLILRFVENLSHAESAEVLGKKEATVRVLQYKGLKTLRSRISKEVNEPPDDTT